MKSILFIWLLAVLTSYAIGKEPIRISTFQVNDSLTVIAKKIMTEAYKQIGEEVVYEYVPAERGIMMANDHIVDGELYRIAGLEKTYPNLIRIPVPICYGVLYVYSLKDQKVKIKTWSDLKPFSISFRLGLKAVEINTAGFRTFPVANLEQALLMLENKRVDFVVDTKSAVDFALKSMKSNSIARQEPALDSMPLYHYINNNHFGLYEKLTRALQQMNKKGLIQKYNQIKN